MPVCRTKKGRFTRCRTRVSSRGRAGTRDFTQDNWYPASGGTEPVFTARSGRRLQYVWQPATGRHAYYDVDNDLILSDEEAAMHLGRAGNRSAREASVRKIEQRVLKDASRSKPLLKVGQTIGRGAAALTITAVGTHTVQYQTADGYHGSLQIPWFSSEGSLPSHERALKEGRAGSRGPRIVLPGNRAGSRVKGYPVVPKPFGARRARENLGEPQLRWRFRRSHFAR